MYKIISILSVIICCVFVQVASFADYSVTTSEPLQPSFYGNYPNNIYANNPYYVNPQNINANGYGVQYSNPYQYQSNYTNPYGYRNYGYSTQPIAQIPYSLLNQGTANYAGGGIKNQIIRNIGQNVLYSMMRGY